MSWSGKRRLRIDIRMVTSAVLVAGLTPAVWYCLYMIMRSGKRWLTSDYIVQLMGGWLATALGVVIGLPVAVWLSERSSAAERDEQALREEQHASEMRTRTLEIVRRELASSLPGLAEMAAGTLTRFHFDVGRWKALTFSGDLKWIRTLSVIDELAEAYEALEVVNVLADTWLRRLEAHDPVDGRLGLAQRLSTEAAGDATAAIGKALRTVDAELPGRDPRPLTTGARR